MGPSSKKPGESRMLSSFTYSDAYLPRQEKKKKTRFDGISVIFLNIRDGRFETRSPRFVDEDRHRDSRGCFFFVVF